MNNLILIGFKAAGKTTLGKKIALQLNRPFIDTDDLFDEAPRDLFDRLGEKEFRALESSKLLSLEHLTGHVIATGGGTILNANNRDFLSQLGTVVFLNTPRSIIESRLPRFLSKYEARLGIYTSMAHHVVTGEDQLWEVIRLDPFSA